MPPVRFRVILRRQLFSRARSRKLISWSSGELSSYNFRARPLLIFVIWSKYSTRAIPRRQPFSRAQSCTLISRPSREHSFYNFRVRPLPIFVIWPKYVTHAISHDSKTATFFARPIVQANSPALSGELLIYFSRATASNICYLA